MAELEFRNLRKVFAGGAVAVENLDLVVADGEFLVLVGPSGSGKTTVLRMAAGLERASSGDVLIGGEVVNDVAPPDRDIAMVFQTYALYPHMTVYDNMAFGLKLHGLKKAEIRPRVQSAAKMLELDDLLKRKPSQLSGGQRQRVAMGRAIVRQPAAFLMDEPLSNLDAKLRVAMRAEIAGIQQRLGVTTIYVTHDQVEAMTMGDRVAVMRKGELQQVASPQDLYDTPVNLFVGGFIGSPAMNMLEATIERSNGGYAADLGAQKLTLGQHAGLGPYEGKQVIIGIRPEDLEDAAQARDGGDDRRLRGRVELREALGSEIMVHMSVDARAAQTEAVQELRDDVGVPESGDDGGEQKATIVGRFTPRSRVKVGDDAEAVVDTSNLHFFDPETGLGIYENQAKGASE